MYNNLQIYMHGGRHWPKHVCNRNTIITSLFSLAALPPLTYIIYNVSNGSS